MDGLRNQYYEGVSERVLNYFEKEFFYLDKSSVIQWNMYLFHLKTWNVSSIQLSFEVSQTFFVDIKPISFPLLRKIALRRNQIRSIEGLDRIQIPFLEQLWIDDNQLVSLPRMNSHRNLFLLYISNNKLQNCEVLSQLHAPLKKLHIEYPQDPEMSPDIRWTFKLQSNNLLSTRIASKYRIKMKFSLINKYKDIKFM